MRLISSSLREPTRSPRFIIVPASPVIADIELGFFHLGRGGRAWHEDMRTKEAQT